MLVDEVNRQVFETKEEEQAMLKCARIYEELGLDALGKHSYDLAELDKSIPAYYWTMFLALPPVKKYRNDRLDMLIETNVEKSVVKLAEDNNTKNVDVNLFSEMMKTKEKIDKVKEGTKFIVTRVPSKRED